MERNGIFFAAEAFQTKIRKNQNGDGVAAGDFSVSGIKILMFDIERKFMGKIIS